MSKIEAESLPLIARYVHESELTPAALAKDVRKKILLSDDDESQSQASQVIDKLPVALIEKTIDEIAERVNYGLSPNDVASSSTAPPPASIPASLQLWRWEVRDLSLLPSERQEDIVQRREERKAARAKALELFNALPDEEREQLLSGKKGKATKVSAADASAQQSAGKSSSKPVLDAAAAFTSSSKPLPSTSQSGKSRALHADEANTNQHNGAGASNTNHSPTLTGDSGVVVIDDSDDEEPQKQGRRGSAASGSNSASASPSKKAAGTKRKASGSGNTKKKDDNLTPEQLAEKKRKEEEKEKKRLQKEAKEAKQRKEQEATKQSANIFSAFFGKPSPAVRGSGSPATPAATKAEGDGLNDFKRTFAPGVYKHVAPINRFAERKTVNLSILDRALSSSSSTDEPLLSRSKALSELVPLLNTRRSKRERATIRPPLSVRDAISLRDNAAIANDADLEQRARQALESLREDRKLVPVKLLQFATDLRPAWFGTWTRPSNMISGRQPLRQDTVGLDYNYDSEAEWGDDEKGEEVDADDGDDAMSVSEDGSDEMDDWLVDDLEDDVEAGGAAAGSGNEDDEDDNMSDILETDPFGNPVSPIAQRTAAAAASSSKAAAASGPRRIPLPGRGGPLKLGGKAGKDKAALKKKKKKVVPNSRRITTKLVPMTIGPCWEETFFEPAHTAFSGYQMEFLNDAYPGLDPFSFVSEDPAMLGKDAAGAAGAADQAAASTSATTFTSSSAVAKPKGPLDALLGVPADDGAPSSSMSAPPSSTGAVAGSSSSTTTPASSHPTAKAASLPLPEDVVLALMRTVEGMEETKPVVIARLYSDLKHIDGVNKRKITETLDAVAQREGRKQDSAWRVKPEWRARLATSG